MAFVFLEFNKQAPCWSDGTKHLVPRINRLNARMQQHFISWAKRVWFTCKIGYVENQAACLMRHGSRADRNYRGRYRLLEHFDPNRDIALAGSGAWKWSSNKPELHRSVAEYFFSRREDEL